NFFLVGMFEQWKNAKDQPALLQADRALAYAQMVNGMARAEFLAQAHEALGRNKLDVASRLFGQAKEVDPSDVEAEGGWKVVQKLKEGKLTLEQLHQQFNPRERTGVRIEKSNETASGRGEFQARRERIDRLLAQADDKPKADDKPAPGGADQALDPK